MITNRLLSQKFGRAGQVTTLFTLVCTLLATPATAANVTLAWNRNTETNLAGYNVYYGTSSRVYPGRLPVGSATTNATVSGLQTGLTYYFAVTATNSAGLESDYSAEVSYTVPGINNVPVANGQSITTSEDTARPVVLTGSDADGNTLAYTVLSQPTKGVLSGTAPNLTYTPAANVNGSDSFTFRVSDGMTNSAAATVSITITPVNDAPIAIAQSVTTPEDTAKAILLAGSDVDGNALTFVIVTPPTKGVLSGTAPNLTYTPNANANGSDSFTFRVSDGTLDSATATVSISITAVNDSPIANVQSVTTLEDTPKAITLSGTDVEGNALTYTVATQPTKGVLSGTAPNLTYTPNANANGSDSFTFRVNDGTVNSASATVAITITPVNDAPVANAQNVAALEDTAKAITLTGSDVEGSALTYTVVGLPTHGTLSGSAPNLTYLPATNYFGSDSFTFRVNDGEADSALATVTITITAVNQAPTAVAQSVTLAEDTAKAITLAGTDPDNNPLVYSVVAAPANGTLSGSAPNLTYTPAANYHGPDSFTFKVNDGKVDSASATVVLTVTPVNDAPTAVAQSISVVEDVARNITLTGLDVDGNALTFSIVSSPAHGTLTGAAPNVTYTPAANYNGADSFSFKVNDGQADSLLALVSINVTAINDAPIAVAQSVSTAEDTSKAITLAGTDTEGGTLTYSVVIAPTRGTLTGTAPNLTYRPGTNYAGADSFSFKVNDGVADSTAALVSITVTPVNDAPLAIAQAVATDRNVAKSITLSGSDVENDALTYLVLTQPSKGVLSGTAPNLTYTPNNNLTGTDSFTFRVNDGALDSASATVAINIAQGPNTVPVAIAQSVSTAEDTAKAITLAGTDADDNTLSFAIISAPTKGTLSGTAPNLTYTPAANFNGSDSFTFKVNDGTADSSPATVALSVTPVNDPPVAAAQSVAAAEDAARQITLVGSDVDGDVLSFSVVSGPAHGTLSGTAPSLTYTPAADYNGPDSFTFGVSDGKTNATASVSITVTPVNDGPVAIANSVTTSEDVAKSIVLTGSDPDGNALTYSIVTQPAHGTLSGTGANRTYTPAANYAGSDSFGFKVNDGTVDSAPATISITVSPVNDTPVAETQSVTTTEDTAKAITLAGSDPDGDPLSYTIVNGPTKGTLSGTAPNVTYTPGTNYHGADSFTFRVSDGTTNSAVSTVSITVTPVNDAPVAIAQSITTSEDTAKAVVLSASDNDGDPVTFTVTTAPTHGTLTGTGANRTYTPAANYNGPDSFWFKANDGKTDSALVVVSISVDAVNDLPIASPLVLSTDKNVPKPLVLSGTDVDGDTLTFEVVTPPSKGVLSGTAPNLTYTPNNNVTGQDAFTYRANDGTASSVVATVTINIAPGPNTAPTAIAQNVATAEDTAQAITLTGSDVDGDTLTFTVVTPPSHGALSGTAPNITYTPAANYNGADTLWFRVSDGLTNSSLAVVSINVTAVNDAPAANAQNVAAVAGVAKALVLSGSDVDGDALSFAVVNTPLHGTLTGTGVNVTYTADVDYAGADAFTFSVNDGTVSVTGIVSINVSPAPNTPPIASAQSVTIAEDAAKAITLSGSDADGDTLVYSIVTQPAHGSLSGTAPNLTYTPATNYFGADSFTFRAYDGEDYSAAATVSIGVTPVNDAPSLNAIADVVVNENAGATTVALSGINAGPNESQPLVITATSSQPGIIPTPAVAYATPSTSGSLSFTPVAGVTGSAVITVTVTDGQSESSTVSRAFNVTVEAVTSPLTLDPIAAMTIEDSAPQQTVTLSGISAPSSGTSTSTSSGGLTGWLQGKLSKSQPTLSVTASSSDTRVIPTPTVKYTSPNSTGALVFAPVPGTSGIVTITVVVADSVNPPVSRSFQVVVVKGNKLPTIDAIANVSIPLNSPQQTVALAGISAGSGETQPLTVLASSSNPGLIPNPEVLYSSPAATGSLRFTPVSDASGSAVITVSVDDGQSENNQTTRTFVVSVSSEALKPAIVLSSPTSGSSCTAPDTITVAANVTANGHSITKVQFFAGSTLLGEDATAPYTADWDCETAGSYTILARALYDSNGSVDSPAVAITVRASGLPAPWDTMDIGNVSVSGMVLVEQNQFSVEGAGRIEGSEDSFRFVHQPLTADGEIWVNIMDLPTTGTGGLSGIMIREQLGDASPFVFIGKQADGTLQVLTRGTTGAPTKAKVIPGSKPATWVRIVRRDNLFVVGYSKKQGSWSIASMENLTMAPNVYTGLAVASGDAGALSKATFGTPSVTP